MLAAAMGEAGAGAVPPSPWGARTTAGAAAPAAPTIRYTLTEADVAVAQRAWLLAGLRWGVMLAIAIVACGLIGAAMLTDLIPATIWPFVCVVVGVALIPCFLYWRAPINGLKLFRQQKSAAHEFTLSWDAEAISFASVIGHGRLPWSLFSSWLDAPATLLLYQSDMLFTPIPKRMLSAGDSAEIAGHLRAAGVAERQRFGFHRAPPGDPPEYGGLL